MHQQIDKIKNLKGLKGLEIDMVYKWKLHDILIFDRSQLHCSSSNNLKKIVLLV